MRLSITPDKTHPRSPWLVVLPARLAPNGKRQYKRFATRNAAAEYIAAVRTAVRRNGEKAMAMMPAALAAEATAALQLLEGSGLSLLDAVKKLLAQLHATAVALPLPIPVEGAGGITATVCQPPPPSDALTVKAASELLMASKAHQSVATVKARRYTFMAIFRANPTLADTAMETLTHDHLTAALNATYSTPTCWNTGRSHLHSLFSFAIRRRLVRMENPADALELRHVTENEITALPPAQLRALFAACRPATAADIAAAKDRCSQEKRIARRDLTHLRPYIALCAFAGIRPTECKKIKWQDIDLEENIISVRIGNAKTGGTRHIELHPTLRAWLIACRPPEAAPTDLITPPKNLHAMLTALRRRAGFSAENPWQNDCLRHSYATYYLKAACGDLARLQLNMGHATAHLLYTRYTNMAGITRAMADEWWQIMPTH